MLKTQAETRSGIALAVGYSPWRKWSIVALLCAAFVIAYLHRQNISIALTAPDFKNFFRLSDAGRGLLNSAFFWTYAALQIPAGWVVDRFGVKWPFAICFAFWSIAAASAAWCETFAALFLVRLLLGACEAVNTPAGMRWIRLNFASEQHGFVMGMYQAAAKVGPAVGGPLIAWLIVAYGWRMMFVVLGFGALLWLAPWIALVRNNDRHVERTVLKKPGIAPVSFHQMLHSPAMWGIIVGSFCYNYFIYFCLTWLPAYFAEQRGLSLNKSGWFTGFSFWGSAIVATSAGFWADSLIRRGGDSVSIRKKFILAGFVLAATELIGAGSGSNAVALFFAIFSLSGIGLATGNYWALSPAILPGAPAARLAAVQNMAANVPGIVAPILTGWLIQSTGSYYAPMIANFAFLLLGMCSYIFLVRRKYAPGVSE